MRPFEIHYARFEWKGCLDERPWLLVQRFGASFWDCFPISGRLYSDYSFEIRADDPEFADTGLTKSCFLFYEHLYQVPDASIRRHKGRLTGDLLHRFRAVSGV